MTKHYRYGGSTADRTLSCIGWRKTADQYPYDDSAGPYADQGTMLHTAVETIHDEAEDFEYDDLLEMNIEYNGQKLTRQLLQDKVIPAWEAFEDLCDEYDILESISEKTYEYNSLIGGTADITAYSADGRTLLIADWKFGDGVLKSAKDNPQLVFYAWLAYRDNILEYNKIDTVAMAIIQPSTRRKEVLSHHAVPVEEIHKFEKEFLSAVKLAEESEANTNLNTGDHCKFCPVKICPEKMDLGKRALRIDSKDKEHLLEIVEEAMDLVEELEPWIKAVREFAYNQSEKGVKVPGWKLVSKQARRHWRDEEKAMRFLSRKFGAAEVVKKSLISPAQAEKLAKRKDLELKTFNNYVTSYSSGTTLVRDDDPRPAVVNDEGLQMSLKAIS